ncbi:uncharacterized protein [Battus philenor]|uniref:uncharacterized protein n=1 Tax=Battus philenor TaxID=42288 RepID=UPI0035D12F69
MGDVYDIIYYIKSLKRGFDKDFFRSKIEELSFIVENEGLEYNEFHSLFKIWLNLNIPISKWISLGACLVPQEKIQERTIEYSVRWLLANYYNQSNFSQIAFLLDWLTAAMDCYAIDIKALDHGYELFYTMLAYEALTAHVMKLVYNLTKPVDVTRKRVLELLDYAKKREAKKNLYRQIQVLLGLFKSYKPETVPENIPSISIHNSFKKINPTLLHFFTIYKNKRDNACGTKQHLLWMNPINCEFSRNKKTDPLVPNMEFLNIGSKQYAEKVTQKNYLDFEDPTSLLEYSIHYVTRRPARLRSMLCNASGFTLLAIGSNSDHEFFSHDLQHLLTNCFFDVSPHNYAMKQDLLHRLAVLQRTIVQGIPVVTRFLAQFLPFWNEKDFFGEILELVEWISEDSPEDMTSIMEFLMKIYYRAKPIEQCAIVQSLSTMYANLVYSSTRKYRHFMSKNQSSIDYSLILRNVAKNLTDMYSKGLQINPEDMCVLFSSTCAAERCARAELSCRQPVGCIPRELSLALPLLSPSAAVIDIIAALILLYRKSFVFKSSRHRNVNLEQQLKQMKAYTNDITSCLYGNNFLSSNVDSSLFRKLHPQTIAKLKRAVPDVGTKLNIRSHLAFAPYTYVQVETTPGTDADNALWFNVAIDREFDCLSEFLNKVIPELRQAC